jgi:hypothetical protein
MAKFPSKETGGFASSGDIKTLLGMAGGYNHSGGSGLELDGSMDFGVLKLLSVGEFE